MAGFHLLLLIVELIYLTSSCDVSALLTIYHGRVTSTDSNYEEVACKSALHLENPLAIKHFLDCRNSDEEMVSKTTWRKEEGALRFSYGPQEVLISLDSKRVEMIRLFLSPEYSAHVGYDDLGVYICADDDEMKSVKLISGMHFMKCNSALM